MKGGRRSRDKGNRAEPHSIYHRRSNLRGASPIPITRPAAELKRYFRSHGLRCISVEQVQP